MTGARALTGFVAGVVFAIGLVLAGMTQPARVIGFLDLASWDPTLAFVMGGAIVAHLLGLRLAGARRAPLFAPGFSRPTRSDIDLRLLAGAGVFGVGWGLAGFCPGPALVSLGGGRVSAVVFVAATSAGMLAQHLLARPVHRDGVSP